MSSDMLQLGFKVVESFPDLSAMEVVLNSESFERKILAKGLLYIPEYYQLIEESRLRLLGADEVFKIASVESLALVLSQIEDTYGILSPIDTRMRAVYRQKRELQLLGKLNPLGDQATLIASGMTVPEAVGLLAQVKVHDLKKLEYCIRLYFQYDLKNLKRLDKDLCSSIAEITYENTQVTAFDPNIKIAKTLRKYLSYAADKGISINFKHLALGEYMNSSVQKASSLVWLRMEPRIFYGDQNPEDLSDAERMKLVLPVFENLYKRMEESGQLYVSVGTGNTKRQKLMRFSLIRDIGIAARRLGLEDFFMTNKVRGEDSIKSENPLGDVLVKVMKRV